MQYYTNESATIHHVSYSLKLSSLPKRFSDNPGQNIMGQLWKLREKMHFVK